MTTSDFFRRMFVSAAAAMLVLAGAANASPIAWSETVVDSTSDAAGAGTGVGDLAVSTDGTLVEAINFGSTDADVTVNGVLFSGVLFGSTTHYSNNQDAVDAGTVVGTTTGGAIDTLTLTFGRRDGETATSGTLTGLTIGHTYQVQFISSFAGLDRTTTFNDGLGNTIVQDTNDPHAFSTGTFTADATTQTLNYTASTGSSFINAYQLRDLTVVPEPSTLALLMLSGIALLLRRRK